MNWKKTFALSAAAVFMAAMVCSCAGDPRKNCNHPQHGQYMSEKLSKQRGIPK